jgi:hypothetical protein
MVVEKNLGQRPYSKSFTTLAGGEHFVIIMNFSPWLERGLGLTFFLTRFPSLPEAVALRILVITFGLENPNLNNLFYEDQVFYMSRLVTSFSLCIVSTRAGTEESPCSSQILQDRRIFVRSKTQVASSDDRCKYALPTALSNQLLLAVPLLGTMTGQTQNWI